MELPNQAAHLWRVLGHEAGVQLLPRQDDQVSHRHADQGRAKADAQQLDAIARDCAAHAA